MTKKRKRRKPEQDVKLLQDGEGMLAAGKTLGEVCQKLEISEATWKRWKKQFRGIQFPDSVRRIDVIFVNQQNKTALSAGWQFRMRKPK